MGGGGWVGGKGVGDQLKVGQLMKYIVRAILYRGHHCDPFDQTKHSNQAKTLQASWLHKVEVIRSASLDSGTPEPIYKQILS